MTTRSCVQTLCSVAALAAICVAAAAPADAARSASRAERAALLEAWSTGASSDSKIRVRVARISTVDPRWAFLGFDHADVGWNGVLLRRASRAGSWRFVQHGTDWGCAQVRRYGIGRATCSDLRI